MYHKEELKKKIIDIIENNDNFTYDEKEVWTEILSNMADFQQRLIENVNIGSAPQNSSSWNISCGITSLDEKQLGKNRKYVSVADNLNAKEFPYGNIEDSKGFKKDGDYFIIGLGYLDCEYDVLKSICGRDKKYKGILSDGKKFKYSLILQNNILNREKLLYHLADFYGIKEPVMYAPMLRRLVYIETEKELKCGLKDIDFKLSENNLDSLKLNWRAVWNVEVSDSYGVKNGNDFYYNLEENEYVLPIEKSESQLKMEKKYNSDEEREVIVVSSESIKEINKHMQKISVFSANDKKEDIDKKDLIMFFNKGKCNPKINRIYSKSDIFKFLSAFEGFLKLDEVYTKYPEDMKVAEYEDGFEYPVYPNYFHQSGRPKVYLAFKKDEKKYFYDRIIYTVNVMQRCFPEYLWKGGFFE